MSLLREGPSMRAQSRVGNVDVLRALAALSVLGIHAYALGGRGAPIKAQFWYDVPLISLATGVWLFFAISGYVISRPFVDRLLNGERLPPTLPYLLRRVLRIFPLYWLALAALIAVDGLTGTRPWQLVIHLALLNNLVPGRQEALFPAAWTLTLEVLFYLAVPILAALLARRRPWPTPERLFALVLLTWAASILFTAVADLQGDGTIGLWLRGSFPAMWGMFCPGILLAIAPHLRPGRARRWVMELPARRAAVGVAVATLVLAALLGAAAPLRFGIVAYQLLVDLSHPLFAVGYGLVLAAALRARPWRGRTLLELGIVSYGIYLWHPVIAALALREGWSPVPHDTVLAFLLNTAALAAVTVPVALVSWRLIESPAIAFARRLGSQPADRQEPRPASPTIRRVPAPPPNASAGNVAAEIREFWNDRAREDAFYFVDTRQAYRDPDPERFWQAQEIVDYVLGGLGVGLRPSDAVLEIGCGIGRITRELSARAASVIALDVSDEMLRRAQELNPQLDRVQWCLGDGVSLAGVEDASIDACISLVVLQHVPDPEITLGYVREVGRVLRPGGWAALQVSNDPELHRPRDGLLLRALARVGRAPQGQRHPAWLGAHVELPALRRAAAEGGLEVEKVWGEGTQYCQVLLRRRPPLGG